VQQAVGARLTLGLEGGHRRGVGLNRLRGELEALALTRMLVAVAEEDRREAPV
jgi:hypothetical protein